MTRTAVLCVVALALATHAAGETRMVTSQATVSGTIRMQRVHAVSNAVVAAVQRAPKARREDVRQVPGKDNDNGMARAPARLPAAKRTQ